jgi:hypothetical protein
MTAVKNEQPRKAVTLFHDEFRGGFSCEGTDATWELRPTETSAQGDGRAREGLDGLIIEPLAVNPETGEPAFAPPADPEVKLELLRWAAFTRHTAASGVPGFDVPGQGVLTVTTEISVRAFGSAGFPGAHRGINLAAALITLDPESGLVFDFAFSNTDIYALYERLPRPGNTTESFSYAVPVARRAPEQFHTCSVAVDRKARSVHWVLDGEEVLTVSNPGETHLDRSHELWRGDGSRQAVDPAQLRVGLGMFAMAIRGQGTRMLLRRFTVTAH